LCPASDDFWSLSATSLAGKGDEFRQEEKKRFSLELSVERLQLAAVSRVESVLEE